VSGLGEGELETAREVVAAVAAGEVTARELTERALERAEAWQPWTNAFSQVWAERALRRAKVIDDDGAEGAPLRGVPITIKDLFDVEGEETTGCSRAYAGRVATRTAPVVERVLAAGAIPIGKTNMHELAAGGTNLVSACGRTGNPWNPAHMTGGSSGGAGVTVATGVAPLALGSDTGGSVRIPASMCGCFGLKPTYGTLPLDGVLPLAPSMDCPGPLASTAGDLGLLFEAMAGVDATMPLESPRIAPVKGFFAGDSHPAVLAAVDDLLAVLSGAGVRIDDPIGQDDESRRILDRARSVWNRTCFPEFAAAHPDIDRSALAAQVRHWMERGEAYTAEELTEARDRRARIRRWFLHQLEEADALVVPTCAYPAPRADQTQVELTAGRFVDVGEIGPGWLTCTVNMAGLPALSIPAGRSSQDLPIGVSLIGRPNDEGTLLALAARWEQACRYHPRRPALPTGDPPNLAP
jgi:aspartyl-tRNA(Asn)/glutamyl-tRNA(Gln) amidotransferase subunit A